MEVNRTEGNKASEGECWWWVSVILNRVLREGLTEKEVRVPAQQRQEHPRRGGGWS